jgi:hypothetical protein
MYLKYEIDGKSLSRERRTVEIKSVGVIEESLGVLFVGHAMGE